MADEGLRIPIKGDASDLNAAAREAEGSLGRIGDKAKSETKNLNLYGERLGKVFGKNNGLHAKLDALEVPLRDVEGGFDRARQTAFVFGNAAETASEKATQGFLLAADSIAAFTSGGVAGLAIAAAVTGFALLAKTVNDEAEAARKQEEATKKQAEALQKLSESAAAANVSIALLKAKERSKEANERARLNEQERRETEEQYEALAKIYHKKADEFNKMSASQQGTKIGKRLSASADADKAELERLEAHGLRLVGDIESLNAKIKKSHDDVLKETASSAASTLTKLIEFQNKAAKQTSKAINKATKKTSKRSSRKDESVDSSADEKEAEAALKRIEERLKAEKALDDDFNEALRRGELLDEERHAMALLGISDNARAQETEAENTKAAADKARAKNVADFKDRLAKDSAELAQRAALAVTGALYQQAKAGEFAADKMLEVTLDAVGQEMVAKGTLYLLEGLGSLNPVKVATGGALIAAGVGLGVASGSIANAPETAAATTTPTDTRQSRAASSGSGGEGGTTVINFQGDVWDRRGVANVLTSGQKMARHRRVAGA